jgi:NADPH:quinone reductase-like Zn-dependent oxidoreductase
VVAAGREVVLEAEGGQFAVGKTLVCALANGGGYAEYCAVPAGQCLPVPMHLTTTTSITTTGNIPTTNSFDPLIAAACVPESYFTVWHNLFQQCNVFGERLQDRPSPAVLIHGGTSGIGAVIVSTAVYQLLHSPALLIARLLD